MTTRQAAGVALKIFAIYLLFSTVLALPAFIAAIFSAMGYYTHAFQEKEPSILPFILILTISIAGCILALWLLWKTSNALIRKEDDNESPVVNDLTMDNLTRLVLSCMGLYLAIHAVLAFLGQYASALNFVQQTGENYHFRTGHFLVPGAQFIIGTLLLARPRQWTRFIRAIGEK